MPVKPLPFLDRTAATFKNDTDTFFGSLLPQFSVEVNQVSTDLTTASASALASKNAAAASAAAALSSKNAAATSETNAATSEDNALASKNAAATSATGASGSATAAATSRTNAATSETNALASKNEAATSATNASTSATNALASKNTATTQATNAGASATASAGSATAAAASATAASGSATAAAGSATAANTSKVNAATSEANSLASKNAAATSATNAAASAAQALQAAAGIADGPVTSVNGKTGVVALVKADVGLGNVDNVSVVASGIGAIAIGAVANMDSFTLTNGYYGVTTVTAGTKPVGAEYGVLEVCGRLATVENTRVIQTFKKTDMGPSSTTKIYARTAYSGTWGPWIEITLPSVEGLSRKPLTTGDASSTTREWSDTLSIPKYIDKMSTATAAASQALNLALATVFDFTLSVNTTFTISNMPSLSGESLTLVIRIRQNATPKTITWFSGITWLTPGGLVPAVPAASQIVEYILSTTGTGTTWVGRVGAST